MNLPKISIIGVGGLGKALIKTLVTKNTPVKSVFNRTEEKAHQLASTYNVKVYGSFPSTRDDLGKLTFITVSDDAIKDVAGRISRLHDNFSEHIFVHCSGTKSAESLQPLKSKGAIVAAFHPLQTFTDQAQPKDFKDVYFSLQGDRSAFPVLQKVAQKIESQTFEVTKEQKSHLHAAAVMASNYLTVLLNSSIEIAEHGGLDADQIKKALLPLVRSTIHNNEKQSAAEVLTGPIKRGDIKTIEQHLSLLDGLPELRDLYCVLGLKAVDITESAGDTNEIAIEKMRKILS